MGKRFVDKQVVFIMILKCGGFRELAKKMSAVHRYLPKIAVKLHVTLRLQDTILGKERKKKNKLQFSKYRYLGTEKENQSPSFYRTMS